METDLCKSVWEENSLTLSETELIDKASIEKYFISLLDNKLSGNSFLNIEPAQCDKWVAVSSLHKSIRRCEVEFALRATATLLSLDPDYLFRRLPIIAYEDVGIANPQLCALTLFASSKRVQNAYGRDRLAYYLTKLLAESVKSRTATDIFCFTLSDPNASNYLQSCLKTPVNQLITIVLDTKLPTTHRTTALKVLSGFSERKSNGYYQVMSKPRLDLLQIICEELNVSPLLAYAVMQGNSKTAGLNVALLLAYEMLSNSQTYKVIDTPINSKSNDGVLTCAYDSYCKVGRVVISEWLKRSEKLQSFMSEYKIMKAARFLGVVLFHYEGTLLNKRLDFDGVQTMLKNIESLEISAERNSLNVLAFKYEFIKNEHQVLEDIRVEYHDICLERLANARV